MRLLLSLICFILCGYTLHSQTTDSSAISIATTLSNYNNLSSKSLDYINSKYAKLTDDVTAKSQKLLSNMQKREDKLKAKLQGIDSTKAKQLFTNAENKYQELSQKLQLAGNPSVLYPLQEYIPGLDSMQTTMLFLQNASSKLPGILSSSKLQQIQIVTTQLQALQTKLQSANDIQDYVREREATLQSELSKYNFSSQLLGINKQVYYYQQQLASYKAMLNDKKLMEQKAISLVEQLPAFQNFMAKNSYLSQLFGIPGSDPSSFVPSPGLQTRTQVSAIIGQRLGTMAGNVNPSAYLQQQITGAQDQLSQLKSKLNNLTGGGSGSSDMTMPNFQPNDQKIKTFLQRIEYGFNIQSEHGTGILPATSDIGVSLGYKLSDKATIGTGMSYKLGWGTGLTHIKLTNEGLGMRSNIDIKAKGSIWITGGYEYNYYTAFASLHDIQNLHLTAWQKSALLGITKKYKVGKKDCNMQLLYDFLSQQEVPQGQALKFRLGYSF